MTRLALAFAVCLLGAVTVAADEGTFSCHVDLGAPVVALTTPVGNVGGCRLVEVVAQSRVVSFSAPEGCWIRSDDDDNFISDRTVREDMSIPAGADIFLFCDLGTDDVDGSVTLADVTCGDGVCNAGEEGSCGDCLCANADTCSGPRGDGCSCDFFCELESFGPCCPDAAEVCGRTGLDCGDGLCSRSLETCEDAGFSDEYFNECEADCGVCANVCGDGKCDPAENGSCEADCTCAGDHLACDAGAASGGGCYCGSGCDGHPACCPDADAVCDEG